MCGRLFLYKKKEETQGTVRETQGTVLCVDKIDGMC